MDVVKVLDFGLVKDLEQATQLTADNVISGTPAYIAPETLTSPEDVGPACDLYALGAVAFFLLVGRPVFSGKTAAEVCVHHIHTTPSAPSAESELEIPSSLDALVLRCLAKSPSDRFAGAEDVVVALDRIGLPRTWDAEQARVWWERFELEKQRHPTEQAPSRPPTIAVGTR
jgi:serine/threonine-protein kinase